MSAAIPTQEPSQIRAGATLSFTKALGDYPAPTWTLKYYLRGNGLDAIDIEADADGSGHSVEIPFTETASWKPGVYDAFGIAASSTERFEVWRGRIEILPDYTQAEANFDTRSQAKRTLDNINATIEGRASATVLKSTVEGTELDRIPHADLLLLKDRYEQIVANEDRANGNRPKRTIFAAFTPTR